MESFKKTKIAYFLHNERPNAGLIKTQVVDLLIGMAQKDPSIEFTLVAFFQPWIFFRYKKDLNNLKTILIENRIQYKFKYLALPDKYIVNNLFFLWFSIFIQKYFYFNLVSKFDIIHVRGYFGATLLSELKKKFGYKLVFDPRSLYPEESITRGLWRYNSKIFKFWKKIERKICFNSDSIIGVSEPMVLDFKKFNENVFNIPCNVNTEVIKFENIQRNEIRKQFGWKDKIVFVYVGSLGLDFWNNVRVYLDFYQNVLKVRKDAHLLIITKSSHDFITKLFEENNISSENFSIIEAQGSKLAMYLSASDIALQLMEKTYDSHTRLGVKFVEYLGAGLPVIINEYVGGAEYFLKKYKLGIVLERHFDINQIITELKDISKEDLQKIASENFSMSVIINKYLDMYNQVFTKQFN